MPKLNRPNLRRNIPAQRGAQPRIGRLKSIARKLIEELENIEESSASKGLVAVDFYKEVKQFEANLIVEALTCSEGHQVRAAQLLNINPSTLNAKIKQYGIETNTFSRSADTATRSPRRAKLRILK